MSHPSESCALLYSASLRIAWLGCAWQRLALHSFVALPQKLTPVDGNEPCSESAPDHAPMAHVEAQDVVHGTEDAQIAIGIRPTLAGFDMVEMTGFPFQDMGNTKLETSKTLASIPQIDTGLGELEPDVSGLASKWHRKPFAMLGSAGLRKATLRSTSLGIAMLHSARLCCARLGYASSSWISV